jgi:hypothetical protein
VPTSNLFFADSPSVSDWPPGDKHTNMVLPPFFSSRLLRQFQFSWKA